MAYRASSLRSIGITQIIIGVLMVLFGVSSLAALHHWSSYSSCGLWIGAWVVLTGMFGYFGAKSDTTPNNCLIGLMIGFAVTACVFSSIMFIIYSIALAEFAKQIRCEDSGRYRFDCYFSDSDLSYKGAQVGVGLGSILLLLAIIVFFVALTSSIYGCNASCCVASSVQTTQQITYLSQQGTSMVVVNSHGTVLPGSNAQALSPYPGQPTFINSGQPQTFSTGYPGQAMPVAPQQGYLVPPPYSVATQQPPPAVIYNN